MIDEKHMDEKDMKKKKKKMKKDMSYSNGAIERAKAMRGMM
mgnify:CR=1 FL=1